MAKVELKKPSIITLEFRQEKGDKDYGSCMEREKIRMMSDMATIQHLRSDKW